MIRPDGAWIFLSHSNEDWDEVRAVRNLLEEKGHRPIMFFLKCLTEDSELDGLVKREIEARFGREERPLFERDNLLAFLDQADERRLIVCALPVTRRTGRARRGVLASAITLCFLAAAVLTWMAAR